MAPPSRSQPRTSPPCSRSGPDSAAIGSRTCERWCCCGTARARGTPRAWSPAGAAGGLRPDVVHTSVLSRAIQTANVALDTAGLAWLPVRRSWRLNERHYGALQGKDKAQVRQQYGDDQFMIWRRSYDVPPPPLADDDPLSQAADARYALLADEV